MKTTVWGPALWIFLHTITFNYPDIIDEQDSDHIERRKYIKELFENLQYTLPCKYCRESFKQFLSELPIAGSLSCRANLTRWLYDIHNKVNSKLRKQEIEAVEKKYKELKKEVKNGTKKHHDAYKELETFVSKTMITDNDPPFEEVSKKYESYRAGSCSGPQKPTLTLMPTCRGK